MRGRIRDEDIAAVREATRLDEVVAQYVTLRPAGGGSMKGLCPFHDERSPSFHVTPARGLYHCFGCGEGGDAITFLQRMDQLSFGEAVERLADRSGVMLRRLDDVPGGSPDRGRERRRRLVQANAAAASFYVAQLADPEAEPARRFLVERGFDAAATERFGVGYAPRSGEALRRHLQGAGFHDSEAVAAGLLAEGGRGAYDRFRGRLLWPIRDLGGDVVGFGARRLYDDDRISAKYLNTPETTLYRKSQVLYGMDLAKRAVGRRSQAVVVEGYTDVMACHMAGVDTAVATCGTAFGEDHARVLRRLLMDSDVMRGEVIFTFDGDAAGRRAALRAFGSDQLFVAQTFVAIEAEGLDPCELRQQHGDAAVRELVARRQPMFEFVLRTTLSEYDLDTAEGRSQALERALPVVGGIKDDTLRDEYARRLAGWLGAEEGTVVRRGRALAGRPAERRKGPRGRRSAGGGGDRRGAPEEQAETLRVLEHGDVDAVVLGVERASLQAVLQHPAMVGPAFDELPTDAFRSPAYQEVAAAVAAAGGVTGQVGGPGWVHQVSEAAQDAAVAALVTELAVAPLSTGEASLERYVSALMLRMQELCVSGRLVGVKAKLQRTDPEAEVTAYNQLFGELMALEARRRALRDSSVGGLV